MPVAWKPVLAMRLIISIHGTFDSPKVCTMYERLAMTMGGDGSAAAIARSLARQAGDQDQPARIEGYNMDATGIQLITAEATSVLSDQL